MAEYTETLATDITFPNIDVYRTYRDGVQTGYRIVPQEGYLMYNTAANDTEYDPETDTEVPIIRYYHVLHCPLIFDFDNFPWRAVAMLDVEDPTRIY